LNDIVLYCKSYRKDFLRLKRLLASIQQFNRDEIPFYVSTPEADKELLLQVVGSNGYHWVSDESIIAANPRVKPGIEKGRSGGLSQQVIKSEFWRLGLAENYVCLDSDCIFITNFYRHHFLAGDGIPYTIIYENKEFYQLADNRGHSKVFQNLHTESETVKALFGRSGPNYYCPCPPFIWSSKVWQSFDREYLEPKGMTFWDYSTAERPETLTYLEVLLKFKAIPVHAIEQLFRVYYYDWHYFLLKRLGETEEKLKQHFLGVIYQSNWNLELDYGGSTKSAASRFVRKLKRFGRYLQSYL
jgi:hypothetical protein